jgi:fumarate hydratase class II
MIINLLNSIEILSNSINSFIENCLLDERLLMIVTNLTPILGYDKCSAIALKAYDENKNIKEVIDEMGLKFEEDIDKLLDPKRMV